MKDIKIKDAIDTLQFPRNIQMGRYLQYKNAIVMTTEDFNKSIYSSILNVKTRDQQHRDFAIVGNRQDRDRYIRNSPTYFPFTVSYLKADDVIQYEPHASDGQIEATNIVNSRFVRDDFKLRRVYLSGDANNKDMRDKVCAATGVITTEHKTTHFYVCCDEEVENMNRFYRNKDTEVVGITELKEIFG